MAGAALLTDYILTVAVSISAGVAAITSAFESLEPLRVEIALATIAVITLVNLRGLRESGRVFAVPTYFFVGTMYLLIGMGLGRWLLGGDRLWGRNARPGPPLCGWGIYLLKKGIISPSCYRSLCRLNRGITCCTIKPPGR